ncbi:MAG: Hsp20/alpha crystallin family protein [Nitriliruptoraceae bacterium]|nr:Hsp20/alpha crystallin family protein [Nitriliruptoraceae bacterium]
MATITRYDPIRSVSSLHDEVERAFRQAVGASSDAAPAGAFSPALDVEEDEHGFTLHVELPGVAPDAVEVSLEENVLTIAGERAFYGDRSTDGFRRIERHFGRFHRSVRLPDRVDGDQVAATYRDGMLTITVPKAEDAKPRRITVQAG